MKRILFSPIGNTDPIRDCYDGGCLHIVRHYHPDEVVLFFTREMWEREQANHCYTRAIRHVNSECGIRCINTDIVNAHLYDSFINILPSKIRELRADDTEILLNLSSGTPQIKTVMAIMAVEDGLRGIQVVSPNKASNSSSIPVQSGDDVEAMLNNNFDDEPDAENRCQEPPLQVIRYFSERQRIFSLIRLYEYAGAYELARGSVNIPQEVKQLLRHAALRQNLMTQDAKKICSTIDGIKLFLNVSDIKNERSREKAESLMEYLLTLVIYQKKGQLSELLVRCNSFLCELLEFYVKNQCRRLDLSQSMKGRKVSRKRLQENYPDLLSELDFYYADMGGFRDSELSFTLLYRIINYVCAKNLADDDEKAKEIDAMLEKIGGNDNFRKLRNISAHDISNITEKRCREMVGYGSSEFVALVIKLSGAIISKNVVKLSGIYDVINQAIESRLEK